MKQCNTCNFQCKNNIGTYVGKTAKVLFLFEAPTWQADQDNRILAGPVMQSFKQYLDDAGISIDDIAITYILHCFPGTEIKDKEFKLTHIAAAKKYIDNCKHYLQEVLDQVKPKLVVTLGSRVTKYFLGDKSVKLENVYDAIIESPLYHYPTFCILDPYVLFMKPQYKDFGIQSYKFIKDFIDGKDKKVFASDTTIVQTKQELHFALDKLLTSTKIAFDIETSGTNFIKDKIMGIGFAIDTMKAYYIPIHKYVEESDSIVSYWDIDSVNEIKEDLKKFVSNEALKITYNGQFDWKFIMKYLNITRINNASFDAMLASHVLNENYKGMRSLKLMSVLFTDMGGYESTLYNWLRKNKITKKDMYKAPLITLGTYCCYDTIATFKLHEVFFKDLVQQGLKHLFDIIVMPLQKVLMETEYYGVQVDINHLKNIKQQNQVILDEKLKEIRAKINDSEFNVNSGPQILDLLLNKLNISLDKKTTSGKYSVDKSVLTKYAKKYPVLQDILDYRDKQKAQSTFIEGLEKTLDENYKVHTSYNINGTDSGRISSSSPNLQNCPRDKNIKNLYIPEPGMVMIQCDLSQGEFNAWASYAQDFKMLNDIKNGLDIHRTVASKVWKLNPEDVTKELRTFAKRVVFGLMYGMSISGAAKLVGCSVNEAQKIQDAFFGMYPKAAAWLNNIPVVAKSQGYLQTVFGRRRRFTHLFTHPLPGIRSYAERLAKNFLMQSQVADITARNIITIKPILDQYGARIILTVHDSIVIQCPRDCAKELIAKIEPITTAPIENYHGIIKNDFEIGESWGHLDKVDIEDNDEFVLEDPTNIAEV